MTLEDDQIICLTEFKVEKAEGGSGQTVRVLRRDETPLSGGERVYDVKWDGRDEQGDPLIPGRYRLVAALQTDTVQCDGSAGTHHGSSLGLLDVS